MIGHVAVMAIGTTIDWYRALEFVVTLILPIMVAILWFMMVVQRAGHG